MSLTKIILVTKREYIKVVRKPSFWISTLILPIVMVVVGIISGFSASTVEQQVKDQVAGIQSVLIVDDANIISPSFMVGPYSKINSVDAALALFKEKKADAVFVYPSDVTAAHNIRVYSQYQGLFFQGAYDQMATDLLKQSILQGLGDNDKIASFNANYTVTSTAYQDGVEVQDQFQKFIVPGIAVILYFFLITFSASFLLLSVSEEKENRMIETILSIIKPRDLIAGKLIGQLLIVLTQLAVLIFFAGVALAISHVQLPFDISQIHVTFGQVVAGVFYLLVGFLIMANLMIGVGAAMPTYKEAQSFSSVFIILTILPVYFASIILSQPSGTIAMIVSYFPLTSPMILLFRSTLGELSLLETVVSTIAVLAYLAISFVWAFKVFELGALEYSRKISFKTLFSPRKFKLF